MEGPLSRRGHSTRSRSYADVEGCAARVRQALGMDADGPVALREAVQRLIGGDMLDGAPVQVVVSHSLPPTIWACTWWCALRSVATITLCTQTAAEVLEEHPRARFSLCHELGHAVLHGEELRDRAYLPQMAGRRLSAHPAYTDTEWQADAFAAGLLMPAEGFDVGRDERWVSEMYMVSTEAARVRLKVLSRRLEAVCE